MSDKWKSNLLSSSFPLEFEVARTLVAKGFAVDADYTYSRDDESGQAKDFSVDISAVGWSPFNDPNTCDGTLELLIECKHRVRGTRWLFLPDVNKPSLSKIYLGSALRVYDEFSTCNVSKEPSCEFTNKTLCCYKGVEVQQADNRVYDAEIRRGIEQLRWALPRLLSNTILNNIMAHREDNKPFLICPILLTTAELMVLDKKLTMTDVEAAKDLSELGKPVPYLITHSGYGPGFVRHCKKACKVLDSYSNHARVRVVDEVREAASDRWYSTGPVASMKDLAAADWGKLGDCFTQFVVCTKEGFPKLIDRLKRCSVQIMESAVEIPGKQSLVGQDGSNDLSLN